MLFHERVAVPESSSVRLGYIGLGFAKVYEPEIGEASEADCILLILLSYPSRMMTMDQRARLIGCCPVSRSIGLCSCEKKEHLDLFVHDLLDPSIEGRVRPY